MTENSDRDDEEPIFIGQLTEDVLFKDNQLRRNSSFDSGVQEQIESSRVQQLEYKLRNLRDF